MKKLILAALVTGLCATARGEIIILKDGTKIEGEITGEMNGAALVKTKYGSLTINKNDIFEPGVPEMIHSTAPAAAQAKP